ncbi:MAG TPA: oxygenase MpaB family protein [Streptosporangiaceae bacterium]|nr:oxygenase MpaB family protein [Streptosporangiaceae bacterium]
METDLQAAAAGLVQRSAAAYVSGVPEDAADDGIFGPASVTWRMSGDLSSPVAGLRSLLLQALHPLAMAGVDEHSGWRQDPVGRLAATGAFLTAITFGERAEAERAAARVRRIHDHVRGVDPVTGRPYVAGDPALLLWVHAALVQSTLAASLAFGTAVSAPDSDRYVAEMAAVAELVGVPRALAPSSVEDLERYVASVRPELCCTPAARESMGYLLDPPGLDGDLAEFWRDVRDAAIAVLPGWAREMYGYDTPRVLAGERQTEIRQSLGVLDAMFLGEPGVLEARQRITLRMRMARSA